MVLNRMQMLVNARAWKEDAVTHHHGHHCAAWKGAFIDDRDAEYAECRCVHQIESDTTPRPVCADQ